MFVITTRFMFKGIGRGNALKGLVPISAAYLIRSIALGTMLPLILRDVVMALSSSPINEKLLNHGLLSLGIVAVAALTSE